jgi:CheY-like chemotaxis protein
MNPLNRSVLVVDDEAIIAEIWCAYIEQMGLEVCGVAETADDAISLANQHRPAVVLMDMRLRGDKDGADAAIAIHDTVGSKLIFITASTEDSTLQRITLDHPTAVLIKPVKEPVFKKCLSDALTTP